MATRTETLTENQSSSYKATWSVTYSADDITVDQSSFALPNLTIKAGYTYSGKDRGGATAYYTCSFDSTQHIKDSLGFTTGKTYTLKDVNSSYEPISPPVITVQTSDVFDASNKTQKTVSYQYILKYLDLWSAKYVDSETVKWNNGYTWSGTFNMFTTAPTITLNVPPTATVSNLTYNTAYKYAGLTRASVRVRTTGTYGGAYYGGDIVTITFTIGNQTTSISGSSITGDDTLSIDLNAGGTFTPTISVTDSRGQTKTYTKSPITVNVYSPPTALISTERTYATGVPYDEGTNATVDVTLTFDDVVATADQPIIAVTDDLGVTEYYPPSTVTWYSSRANDGTLSGSVTWANLSSGDTVYALLTRVGDFDPNKSYLIAVTPKDSEGTGTTVTQTLSTAFYTIDFLAGGHGIAFGRPATQTGFYVDMDTHLLQGLTITGTTETLDAYIDLPNYQTSGTDKTIYDAIVSLGWDSDVLS